ncbi:MAG: hypothetical protein FJX72_14055 [Armatimonadetes bacterium]|nr:hypothetical protein [Armatimonadota bacterium]
MGAIDLPDVKVWIALSVPGHEHRDRAEAYWRAEAAPQQAFCTVTMLGLVRVCSNARLFDGAALSCAGTAEVSFQCRVPAPRPSRED